MHSQSLPSALMGRPCSVCRRSDAEELDVMARTGMSSRSIALKNGIHPRVLSQHFKNHRGGILGHLRASKAGNAALARARESVSVLGESAALLLRVGRVLDAAEKSRSHALTLAAVREAKGLLSLIGQANGTLSQGTQVTVAVGVSVDRARAAVELVDAAEGISECELADRAVSMLRLYNASHPGDERVIERSRGVMREAEVVEVMDASHDGERDAEASA